MDEETVAKAQAGGNDGRTWEKLCLGLRVREVAGVSQELTLVLGEWVTERRGKLAKEQVVGKTSLVLYTLGLACARRWV